MVPITLTRMGVILSSKGDLQVGLRNLGSVDRGPILLGGLLWMKRFSHTASAFHANEAQSSLAHRKPVLDIAEMVARVYARHSSVIAVASLLREHASWRGAGVSIGLLESAINPRVDDLLGSRTNFCCFARRPTHAEGPIEHGTYSATLLVGQGRQSVLGLVPRARLSVALVGEADGKARPANVAAAIDWLVAQDVDLLAIPFGDTVAHEVIATALERADTKGLQLFAAAGNAHPLPVAFPARLGVVQSVGAVHPTGELRVECCSSPELDQYAPGSDIPALVAPSRIEARSGSSVACVVAAGFAALSLGMRRFSVSSGGSREFAFSDERTATV